MSQPRLPPDFEMASLIKAQTDELVIEATIIATYNYQDESQLSERRAYIDYLILTAILWYTIRDSDQRSEVICHILDAFETTIG